jgi:hypothetical protein
MGSIQDPHGYLPAVPNQGPGYAESFRRMGFWTRFYRAISHSERGFPIEPLQLPRIVQVSLDRWPLPDWMTGPPPQGSIAIPFPLQEAAFGHLDPYTCRMSSPKMN